MKNLFFILAATIVVIVLVKNTFLKKEETYEPVACTMDAMMCPDGSYVGRIGPKCEFQKCPDIVVNTLASIGQTIIIDGVSITPTKIVEDSRCPTDVQCIQAGTVRVEVILEKESDKKVATIGLSSPVTFLGKKVELISVTPDKNSKVTVKPEEYKFEFSIK